MTTEISISAIQKTFGEGDSAFHALKSIDLDIQSGEFFTLLGPSGCGKTTLLRIIAGFEQPTSGSLKIQNQEMAGLSPSKRPVNTVFQSYALFPHMTVAENIGFGLKMLGQSRQKVAQTVKEMLELVQMQVMADRKPAQLSGGQQQRVALARALAPHPRVLLLDEPLSALDLKLRKEMQSELKRLQLETGITFVFVTHDQEEALTMSDRIAVMSAGKILQVGTPHVIYNEPADPFVADFIGETNFLILPVTGIDEQGILVRLPQGRSIPVLNTVNVPVKVEQTVKTVIRPEQAEWVPLEEADVVAELTTSVFFGTDTHWHLRLSDGQSFVLRRQNRLAEIQPKTGESIGLKLAPGALRVIGE